MQQRMIASNTWRTISSMLAPVREVKDVHLFRLQRDELVRHRSSWQSRRAQLADYIESSVYEWVVGVLIVANVLVIVHDADSRAGGGESPGYLEVLNTAYLVLYSIDLVVRLYVYRWEFRNSGWNILDAFVVISDLFATCMSSIIGGLPSFGILRICRIFRLFRALRVLRLFRELDIMLSGFLSAMRAMFWASAMLIVMTTLWSIVAVEVLHPINVRLSERGVYDGCERCTRAYSSVLHSNLTFMQQILAGDSWGLVSIPIIEEEPLTFALFFSVFVTTHLGLLNLVLTVIVDVANAARDADEQKKVAERVRAFDEAKDRLMEICKELDRDGSGYLSLKELVQGMDTSLKFSTMMAYMGINKSDMHLVFSVLDEDNSGMVRYAEFVEQLYRLKTQDDHTMLVFIRGYINEVRLKVSESLAIVRDEIRGEVKSLWEQSHALVYGTGILGEMETQPLEIRMEDTTKFGSWDETGWGDACCTCEIVGKPRTRINLERTEGPNEASTWQVDELLEGYSTGDSLLFILWSQTQDEAQDHRPIGRAVLRGDDLSNDAECVHQRELRFRAQNGTELSWRPVVSAVRPEAIVSKAGDTDGVVEGRSRRLGLLSLDEDLRQLSHDLRAEVKSSIMDLSARMGRHFGWEEAPPTPKERQTRRVQLSL